MIAGPPLPTGLEARAAALDVLTAVLHRRTPLDEALAGGRVAALAPRDRAFVRMLAATTLRRLGQADAAICRFVDRRPSGKARVAMDILLIGAVQLLFLRTAAHAAVDAAVRLAAEHRQHHMKGLVNAVLRRIADEGEAILAGQDAARLNTPGWLWEAWSAAYGPERCRAMAEAHLAEPPLDFTARADPERWAAALEARVLPTGTVRRAHGGAVSEMPGYDEGAWWIQDAAAALPARVLLDALEPDPRGRHVIDLCAAPGGKTAQLAAAGARVIAVERAPDRLTRLSENLQRLRLDADIVPADARTWRPEAPADGVLLDAPCTATGTMRRHPDIARTRSPADVARLARVQAALLDAAADMVAPGGVLVYSVCSLQPEEGAAQVASFLSRRPDFARAPVAAAEIAAPAEAVNGEGDVMTLPCFLVDEGGMDGFYAARLRRG